METQLKRNDGFRKPVQRVETRRNAKVWCDYIQPTPDPVQEKLAQIEAQMEALRSRVPDTATANALLDLQRRQDQVQNPSQSISPGYSQQFQGVASPISISESHGSNPQQMRFVDQGVPSPGLFGGTPSLKRKRGDFELNVDVGIGGDVISKGLISYDDAVLYFGTFFQGCDKYVPIFDPRYDTFDSVRQRSSMLFDIICAVGCRAEHGPGSEQYQLLSNATKGPLCEVILGAIPKSLETVQALIVHASYSEKGWLLTSMAVRMSLDLNLPGSYTKLSDLVLNGENHDREEEARLMRETRVWFETFVLEHILSIDCGKRPGIKAVDGMRRCRVLLGHPSRTSLDFRLLAQVELNSIRALAHERLSPAIGITMSDEEMNEIVQETRIDLSVWFSDWSNLVSGLSAEEQSSLIINLKIQREWSEMTMLCKGLQGMGIENNYVGAAAELDPAGKGQRAETSLDDHFKPNPVFGNVSVRNGLRMGQMCILRASPPQTIPPAPNFYQYVFPGIRRQNPALAPFKVREGSQWRCGAAESGRRGDGHGR
ncbi:uncharacterized protein PAC_03389 [Phialocephala subalpina]|uniref:Xylanolytic transcriptional activator regulatory domain-containing protein n=1 Tax=Phialocephala subalpina TaxID=576137 RepID=A0A1L7WL47_9HELO|nr:uncharacterized protein PAC_03389 [Phialocephala subalpina]